MVTHQIRSAKNNKQKFYHSPTLVISNHIRKLFWEKRAPGGFYFQYSLAWKSFPQENNTRKGTCQSLLLASMAPNTSISHYMVFAVSQQAQIEKWSWIYYQNKHISESFHKWSFTFRNDMLCIFFQVYVMVVFPKIRIKVIHGNPFFLTVWPVLLSTELYTYDKSNNCTLLALPIFHFDSQSKHQGRSLGTEWFDRHQHGSQKSLPN